ncbi:hypothetical protein [Leptospira sp. GIMC2001]|uniref:hypothetical protein n=1 Tax=Leptospira sp. GIMC2001 TaxID=1513297 RepID=UPI00234AE1CB|nr:hypothetical protein [Leptospira sp. GIMC2001]WCL51438.1 hypothetical protein O4O04_20190 [Leptospira sp. GIMC2001]
MKFSPIGIAWETIPKKWIIIFISVIIVLVVALVNIFYNKLTKSKEDLPIVKETKTSPIDDYRNLKLPDSELPNKSNRPGN